MTPVEREAAKREAQGLPRKLSNPEIAARIAAIIGKPWRASV